MHFLDFPDRPALHQRHRLLVDTFGMNLDAHLGHQTVLPGIVRKLAHIIDVMGERLLAVGMFAALHGRHRDGRVHVVGRRNIDRVDVVFLLLQQVAPILIHPHSGILFHHLGHPVQIDVSHRDEVDLLGAANHIDVETGHAARAKTGMAQSTGGRGGDRPAGNCRRHQSDGAERLEKGAAFEGGIDRHGKNLER